jgi:hypothetical protein
MPRDIVHPPYDQFLLTAERVTEERPDVGVDVMRGRSDAVKPACSRST